MTTTANEPLSQNQYLHRGKPVHNPRLDLLEKGEVRVKRPSIWNIVIYNDDYTPMDFVEFVFKTVLHIDARCAGLDLGRPYARQRHRWDLHL